MYVKLAFKIWCHFVSNLQRYDIVCAHVPIRVWQFASEKLQYTGMAFYISVCNSRNIVSVSFFGVILKATNSSFKKGMTFCRSIYV